MHRKMLTGAGICMILAVAAMGANAQSADRWDRLGAVSVGTRLIVEQAAGRALRGRFARVSDRALVMKAGGRDVDVPRDSITAVYSARRASRVKRAVIGALAGAGAGVGLGVAAVALGKGDPLIAAGGFLIGIPVGAVIGAATAGSRKGELLYSR